MPSAPWFGGPDRVGRRGPSGPGRAGRLVFVYVVYILIDVLYMCMYFDNKFVYNCCRLLHHIIKWLLYRIAKLLTPIYFVLCFFCLIRLFVLGLGRPSKKASAAEAAGLRNPPPSSFCTLVRQTGPGRAAGRLRTGPGRPVLPAGICLWCIYFDMCCIYFDVQFGYTCYRLLYHMISYNC